MIKFKALIPEGVDSLWSELEHWADTHKGLTFFHKIDHIQEIAPQHGILIAPNEWIRIFSEYNRVYKTLSWDRQKQWFEVQFIKYNKRK